jgi:hypothetical protein
MAKLVHIPESTLEGLLREAGRTESVDAYLRSAAIQGDVQEGQRLLRRARAAYWSRFWLFASAFVTWALFLPGPSVEGFISGVLLTGMTIVEFKVYSLFLAADARGAIYGWWNQCLFSVLFLIYGVYHGTYVTPSPEIEAWVDPSMMPMLATIERITYYSIAFAGGLGQFVLACYYRTARKNR